MHRPRATATSEAHLAPLLADPHRGFFEELTNLGEIDLGPVTHHNTASYTPTDLCDYHRPDAELTPDPTLAMKFYGMSSGACFH